jgi:hypothetical protein
MVKKPKQKKGGKTFVEKLLGKTIEGPFIADDINYNIKKGRSVALKEEYKLRKELADEDYKLAENKLKNEEDKNQKIADRDFKYNKLNQDNFNFKLRLFWDFLITIASAIKDSIAKFFNFLMKTFGTVIIPGGKAIFDIFIKIFMAIVELFNLGQGAIIKLLVLIVIIGICVGIGFMLFSPSSGGTSINKVADKTSLDVFVKMDQPSLLSGFSGSLNNLVPDSYKIQFTSFKNMINRAIGNDIVAKSINNKPREDIKNEGRYNGVTNIRIDNSSRIYSILQPKEKLWEIKLNDYENIDFHKIPDEVKVDILKTKANRSFVDGDINNYQLKYKFNVGTVVNNTNNGEVKKYRYELNTDNIPIKIDNNLINNFDIKEIKIDPITITNKDIDRDKDKLMFSFNNGKFTYPK